MHGRRRAVADPDVVDVLDQALQFGFADEVGQPATDLR